MIKSLCRLRPQSTMASIQLADGKFKGNAAQYLVDLNDSKQAFNFCGGMMFQLKLTDMLRDHLVEVAKSGNGQPEFFDASKRRMNRIPNYSQCGDADNIRVFHGREVRQVPDAAGGMGFVLQLSHSGNDPEGWSQQEGWTNFKKTYGERAYGLNHRCFWHLDDNKRLWLSAEDGCEGVYPPR